MRSAKRSSRTTPSNRWMQCTTSLRRRRSTSNVIEKSSNPSLPSPTSSSHHDMEMVLNGAHSTAKCNGEIFGVEENLTRSSVAEYLSGTRVEFILDPLDLGIRHNREIGTFWEVLSE